MRAGIATTAGLAVVVGDHEVDDVADWTVDSHSLRGEQQPQGGTVRLNPNSVLQVASSACDAGRIGDNGSSLVLDKMGATRSLDGRQADDWNGIGASWSYHPDDGLHVILELTE